MIYLDTESRRVYIKTFSRSEKFKKNIIEVPQPFCEKFPTIITQHTELQIHRTCMIIVLVPRYLNILKSIYDSIYDS